MELRTYRAKTLQEALAMVRRELGPDASVLHTRDVRDAGLLGWMLGLRRIEVTASKEVNVPSRLPEKAKAAAAFKEAAAPAAPAPLEESRLKFREELTDRLTDLQAMVEDLRRSQQRPGHDWPEPLLRALSDLIGADFKEDVARELIEQARAELTLAEQGDARLIKARLEQLIERRIAVTGPICVTPGRRRAIALVGPTGVGKTTTIAKLAAHYRLKEKRTVGLITVDTYRIAAVEQLRTYADIIELPMEVVSTPKEMREAALRLDHCDLILLDTAGRSPSDEIKIQELKSMIAEAGADEVHLVLSSVASAASLAGAAERFASVGVTALLLTKLDEAASLGPVWSLLRASSLPVSYLTDGQDVPDDIRVADARRLAQAILRGR